MPSPQRTSVVVRSLSTALREADATIALREEELAALRAMLLSRGGGAKVRTADSPSSKRSMPASHSPPGIVARLQADLQEAAEERRIARLQAHALRERVRELEEQLGARQALNAEDMERRLQQAHSRQKEQAQQITALKQALREHSDVAVGSSELAAQLRSLHEMLNAERTRATQLAEQLRRSETAEEVAAEKARSAQEEVARRAAQARRVLVEVEAQHKGGLEFLREDARLAAMEHADVQLRLERELAALRQRMGSQQQLERELAELRQRMGDCVELENRVQRVNSELQQMTSRASEERQKAQDVERQLQKLEQKQQVLVNERRDIDAKLRQLQQLQREQSTHQQQTEHLQNELREVHAAHAETQRRLLAAQEMVKLAMGCVGCGSLGSWGEPNPGSRLPRHRSLCSVSGTAPRKH